MPSTYPDERAAEARTARLNNDRTSRPQLIADALASYTDRHAAPGAPYDAASLATIYAPRVRQLHDLAAAGYTHAQWRWDSAAHVNRWEGIYPDDPPCLACGAPESDCADPCPLADYHDARAFDRAEEAGTLDRWGYHAARVAREQADSR